MDSQWQDVRSDIPYVFYLPPKETQLKDEPPKQQATDFVTKSQTGIVKLLDIVTADFLEKEQLTYVVANFERTEGKKKLKELIGLDSGHFFTVQGAEEAWTKFTQTLPEIQTVHFADSYVFSKVQKVEVRYKAKTENTLIFAEHFAKCPAAQTEWNKFADRKLDKRDTLKKFEKPAQDFWAEKQLFYLDAVEGAPKWVGTFPYPYMNGALHLGHSFTIGKIDFEVGYQRLKGKKALFPFAFHCTGMPIKSCADKLKREVEQFGNPPVFPGTAPAPVVTEASSSEPVLTTKRVTAKAAQKGSGSKYQWQIMESLGVPTAEIGQFADAHFWLKHFPPRAMTDLKSMGTKIDWRRSFITTDVNPFYDVFIRWQFNKLYKQYNKIKFGKRPTIYSPLDGQPCMDHDRAEGENVGVSEYTVVKQRLVKPYPACLKSLEDTEYEVFFAPATLRPETMYGQTNCWVLPTGDYGAYLMTGNDVFVMTPRAARNFSFQERGPAKELATFKGSDLIGAALNAPLSKYSPIYVLPMYTVKTNKSTGVVTSVPSDSPDDFAAYTDVKNKFANLQKTFPALTEEMIKPEPTPIINIPSISDLSAVTVCKNMGIKSQNDTAKLVEAKNECYLKGFTEGIMLVGDYAGKPVQEAKPLLRKLLIEQKQAVPYHEPDGQVVSRSGDECVVALCDQWYLDYGEAEWQQLAFDCVKQMDTYDVSNEVRHQVESQLKIIHQWACSRSYGLGSKIPWDEKYLVESLSDSTIYMAFYTIAHILQGENNLDGQKPGPYGITAAQMTDEVFDYIFSGAQLPTSEIPTELLTKMRTEFKSWYPIDLRATGKDLIPNHILFWIYNHVAFFPPEQWPRGLKANGWLLLNGEKMAKRTGNFVTLADGCVRYGVDAMRFALANAGDGMDDPNFTVFNVDTGILQTHTFWAWAKEMIESKDKMTNTTVGFAERVFEAEMNRLIQITDHAYSRLEFREVLNHGFFGMSNVRDEYIKRSGSIDKLNWKLIEQFIRFVVIMMAPITSHTSEHIWRDLLGEADSVFNAPFPTQKEGVDMTILDANKYISLVLLNARSSAEKFVSKSKKQPTAMRIYVASSFPEWHQETLKMMKQFYETHGTLDDNKEKKISLSSFILSNPKLSEKTLAKKVMDVMGQTKKNFATEKEAAFVSETPFNEVAILEENTAYLKSQLKVENLTLCSPTDPNVPEKPNQLANCVPGKAAIFFE